MVFGFLLDVFAQRFTVTAHDQRERGNAELPPGPCNFAQERASFPMESASLRPATNDRVLNWRRHGLISGRK